MSARPVVAAAIALVVLGSAVTAEAAAIPSWQVQLAPLPDTVTADSATTTAVSCTGNARCVLIVSSAHAGDGSDVVVGDVLHGASLSTQVLPVSGRAAQPSLSAVGCTTLPLCFAAGSGGGQDALFETYDGSSWTASGYPGTPPPGLTFTGVACSRAECLATGYYEEYDGRLIPYVVDRDNATGTLTGHFVDTSRVRLAAVDKPYQQLRVLFGPACTPGGACYGVGYAGVNGFQFTDPFLLYRSGADYRVSYLPVPDGINPDDLKIGGLSCPAAKNCATIGTYLSPDATHQYLSAEVLRNGVLESIPIPIPRALSVLHDPLQPRDIDCPSVDRCVGVVGFRNSTAEHGALIVRYDGTHWTARPAPAPPAARDADAVDLTGAACMSASSCVATGSYVRVVHGAALARPLVESLSGGTWTPSALPLPSGLAARATATLSEVSCGHARCLARGEYDVTGPTPQAGPIVALTTVAS